MNGAQTQTTELADVDRRVLSELQEGLPCSPRPYAAVAARLGFTEAQVLAATRRLTAGAESTIKRLGIVVHHRELGYTANAMAVWALPDASVDHVGGRLAQVPEVTLCYRRQTCPPNWPYNLYCMVHGKHRDEVCAVIARINREHGLLDVPHTVLFSRTRFKQCGGRYVA